MDEQRKSRVERINELARKGREGDLSAGELSEQKKLREEYLSEFRKNFRQRLENIKFVDEDGNEIKKKNKEKD